MPLKKKSMRTMQIICDRGKSQGRRIELTESDFRDEVTKKDNKVGLTKPIDRFMTRMER